MARITCPECNGKGGHVSSGDGWSEWDNCRCCDKAGNGTGGTVSAYRLRQFRKEQAAEEAHWDKIIAEAQARDELE